MYNKNPDIDITDINDPFYNDICVLFTSDNGTDMTLNDRRDEYFISKSLCEGNCILNGLIDRNAKNPRSSCLCDIKYNFISNENSGKKDEIPHISSLNVGSFVCIKQAFNSQNISKNPIFWILLLAIIFFILMLLAYIFFGNRTLKKIFKLGNGNLNTSSNFNKYNDKNSEIKNIENEEIKIKEDNSKKDQIMNSKMDKIERSLSKISKIEKQDSIPSNENINIIMNNNINKLEFSKSETDKKLNQNRGLISDRNENEKIEINKIGEKSSKSNPPKKKEEKKNNSITTRANNDKDLISNDYSLSKNININYNNSEISFDNISHEKPVYIDNLISKGSILENNFLDYPMKYERNLIFEYYKKYFYLNPELNTEEINKLFYHLNTMEDDYFTQELKKNKRYKLKNRKNKKNSKIAKMLGGEDLLNQADKNYESDNYYEKDYNKNKNKFKYQDSREDSLFENNILINSGSKKIPKNARKIKEESEELIETSKMDSEISGEKGKIFKHKRKRKNNFLSSLTKKNEEQKEESNYGKKEDYKNTRLKTDCDESGKYLIKSTLKLIGKEGLSNEYNSSSHSNEKSFISVYNEKNKNKNNFHNKLKSKKNKKKFKISEEETIKGDKNNINNINDINNIKDISIKNKIEKNKKEEIKIKSIDDIEKESSKKSDINLFYDKALNSSLSSSMDIFGDKVLLDENIYLFYWKYLRRRELFLVCFFDKKDSIPYFIRWSTFIFCLIFIFTLNCFFFFESNVHIRYQNALERKSSLYNANEFGNTICVSLVSIVFKMIIALEGKSSLYNANEFGNTICVSLVSIVFKMIIVKLLLNRAFKINQNDKEMMKNSYEKKLEDSELDDLRQKRYNYLITYQKKLLIFFIVLFVASLFLSYICICYGAVFENSLDYFFLGFLFSGIFSFIFCGVVCIIIVGIGKLSRIFKKKCLLSIYIALSKVY